MLCCGNFWIDALSVVLALCLAVYGYFKYSFTYWKKRNVQFAEPKFPFGSLGQSGRKRPFALDIAEIYTNMKAKGLKHAGFFMTYNPVFLPIDTELIKNIMARDFIHFVNRGLYFNEKDDPLSAHLFAIEDEKWKNLRAKLTPTFTSGKLKLMFETMVQCGVPLNSTIEKFHVNKEPIDIKEMVAKFTTDIIGSCAFGIECNSFKDPDAEFRKYGKKVFHSPLNLRRFVEINFPKLAKMLRLRKTDVEVSEFFLNMVKNTVLHRESNNIRRNDFMQLLIDMRTKEDDSKHDGTSLTMNELSAQAFVFFLAGFETSSTTLTYCLYELSQNQEVQSKARAEIQAILAKHDGKITYGGMMELKYTEQCINETLRKYPPVPNLIRICTKKYNVPDSDLVLEKGTKVFISAYGLHHDPEHYPEPEKFNPDRFSDKNKENVTPYTFLPFGEGPRVCIGSRFGMLQTKVGLATILKNYKLHLNPKTPKTLTMNPKSFILTNLETIFLDTEKV